MDSIRYVYEHELMYGTTDTTFAPDDALTRGMFVTMLYRMEGKPEVDRQRELYGCRRECVLRRRGRLGQRQRRGLRHQRYDVLARRARSPASRWLP